MVHLLMIAQLAGVVPESVYASERLRAFVAEASRRNRELPIGLVSYRAAVESEVAVVARRAEGTEAVVSLEQISNDVRWRVPGEYEQRVIGYRSQAMGPTFSSLGFIRQPWTVPILYGNRLSILFGRDTTRRALLTRERQRVTAVHPLSADRDRVYRFRGGDTVITMRVGDRVLPIVRVVVEPREDAAERVVAFRGELDVDATRHHLVRMRGYFVRVRAAPGGVVRRALRLSGFEAIAFVELENGEFDGQYWLPTYQRFEAQAAWTAATDARSIYRIVSRYRQHQVNDTVIVGTIDSLVAAPYRLGRAPSDSLARYNGWRANIGDLSSGAHSDDFNDIAPDIWRPTGAPRTAFRVQRLMDAFRVNRIEGAFTGWGIERRFRDQVPGLTMRATGGWAWSEGTARGRVSAELTRGRWTFRTRGGRSLDITNDFRSVFDSGSTIAALLGVDDYDYVDRRFGAVGIQRDIGKAFGRWRIEAGPARDAMVVPHLARGLFEGDSGFRANRGVDEGRYWRSWALLEWHPDVDAMFMRTGTGGALSIEHGRGELDFTRIEARVMSRTNAGRWSFAARGDAGAAVGDRLPPQQLFELGRVQRLQGYGYKEFVGDRAIVLRGLAMWRAPLFEAPLGIGRLLVPGFTPALAVGVQSAWSALLEPGSQVANFLLESRTVAPSSGGFGAMVVPVSRETGGVRTSVTLGLRFFAGSLGVGLARPIDRGGAWKLRVDFGQAL